MISTGQIEGFTGWRKIARNLLSANIPPAQINWDADSLFSSELPPGKVPFAKVPPDFLNLAKTVACHCDPSRWSLLYRILWRITHGGERHLMQITSDPEISKASAMAKNVRREIHKMHAFVRFKLISTDEESGRERYAAWFEPDHHVIEPASPFFRERFSNMDWSIFSPKGCVHWIDGEFSFSPGLPGNPIEHPDVMESAWSTYYRSIFNPARLKTAMMQSEMPKRYWKNLPEAVHIPDLISKSRSRVDHMLAKETSRVKQAPALPYLAKLRDMSDLQPVATIPQEVLPLSELKELAANCRACPLWENATCTVFGKGPENARIMIVGEQPGDQEDISGEPFIGPAGKLLDRALAEAGIDRSEVYVTNAVKHFKWTPRGKLRLHQKPDPTEIDACRPWLLAELKNIQPDIIILLGGTAARSLLGKDIQVTKDRGAIDAPNLAPKVIVTVHPSYLLRLPTSNRQDEELSKFIVDLQLALIDSGSPDFQSEK